MTELAVDKILSITLGKGIVASGRIPTHSEFFQDHFPDFPVLPGVLALEMLKQTAEVYLAQTHDTRGKRYFLKRIQATRFLMYLKPGDEWESHLTLIHEEGLQTRWHAELRHKNKVAVTAELILEEHTDEAQEKGLPRENSISNTCA